MDKKCKILLINNGYPTEKYPNYATYIQSIEQCLIEAGADVDLLVLRPSGRTFFIKMKDYLFFLIKILFKSLKEYDILYINHYTFLPTLMLKLHRFQKNVIFHWHGEELLQDSVYLTLLRKVMKKTIRPRYIHISPSDYYINIVSNILNVSRSNIYVSPSGGVDTEIFKKQIELKSHDYFDIGFCSGFSLHKGVSFLYEIAKGHQYIEEKIGKKIRLHYIRYGEELDSWESLLKKQTVILCPYEKMKKEEMVTFYNELDVCLMLSKRESLGLVALEAMACGVPVLGSNVASFPEMILSGVTGEIVSLDVNGRELLNILIKIYRNLTTYKTQEFVKEKYSRQYVITQYIDLINKLS